MINIDVCIQNKQCHTGNVIKVDRLIVFFLLVQGCIILHALTHCNVPHMLHQETTYLCANITPGKLLLMCKCFRRKMTTDVQMLHMSSHFPGKAFNGCHIDNGLAVKHCRPCQYGAVSKHPLHV